MFVTESVVFSDVTLVSTDTYSDEDFTGATLVCEDTNDQMTTMTMMTLVTLMTMTTLMTLIKFI